MIDLAVYNTHGDVTYINVNPQADDQNDARVLNQWSYLNVHITLSMI